MSHSRSSFNNLLKNSSMMFLLNIASAGVSVLAIPLSLKIIGIAAFGHLVLVQSIALAVFTVCNFQYWQGLLIELPGRRLLPQALSAAVWKSARFELLAVCGVMAVMLILKLFQLSQLSTFSLSQLILLALAAIFPIVGTPTAYFRLINKYQVLMLAGLLSSLLRLLSLFLAAHFSPSAFMLVLAYFVPEALRCAGLFLYIHLARKGLDGSLEASTVDQRRIVRAGRWSTFQAICDLPVAQLDRVILGFSLSGEYLGVFSILKRIYALVNMASAPFYSASIPEFASRVNAGDVRGAFTLWLKTLRVLSGVSLVAGALCFASQKLWMPLIFSGLQSYPWEFAVVLASAMLAGTFVTTHALYWSLGKLRQTTIIAIGSNVFYLMMLWLLTSHYGLLGSVSAFLVHVSLVAILKIFLLRRLMPQ
ncbi:MULTISPECIES: lipopolysaccharide biosynthesis protein [unclassified Janthinobacterium]|uniref:lipopolysaccharide biosynthesis protein n=1 Tax=unclassified Janthinobacterium TaxID=2610881 RepID=UPI000C0D8F9B|nr:MULTISPECIES: oligosaccharide flippase family protein [unclassified Janthinobacterium]MCC7681185.1 oligosaccharide flippase family protein [Janthinobacterium sp. FW305-128]PHV37788.1 hypothetical protein CSQ95_17520 [Janthinobacterium sp. BJB304]